MKSGIYMDFFLKKIWIRIWLIDKFNWTVRGCPGSVRILIRIFLQCKYTRCSKSFLWFWISRSLSFTGCPRCRESLHFSKPPTLSLSVLTLAFYANMEIAAKKWRRLTLHSRLNTVQLFARKKHLNTDLTLPYLPLFSLQTVDL